MSSTWLCCQFPPNLVFPNSSILNPPGLWAVSRLTSYHPNKTSASSQVAFPSAAVWQEFMWCYSRHDWRLDGGIKPEKWLSSFIRFSWSDTPAHTRLQKIDEQRQMWWNSHPSVLWPPPPTLLTPLIGQTLHITHKSPQNVTDPATPHPPRSSLFTRTPEAQCPQRPEAQVKGKSPVLGGERMWYNSGWAAAETQPGPRRLLVFVREALFHRCFSLICPTLTSSARVDLLLPLLSPELSRVNVHTTTKMKVWTDKISGSFCISKASLLYCR